MSSSSSSSSSASSSASSGGMSAIGLLGVIFVLLKLFGLTAVADWSWWWVTAPFWGGFALFVAVAALTTVGFVGALALNVISDWQASRRRAKRQRP